MRTQTLTEVLSRLFFCVWRKELDNKGVFTKWQLESVEADSRSVVVVDSCFSEFVGLFVNTVR